MGGFTFGISGHCGRLTSRQIVSMTLLMKAIVYHNYGSPNVLRCEEIEKPVPGDEEVLVKVRAAAANPLDWHLMRGEPFPIRIMGGLRRPKDARPGVDVAGQVAAVGAKVTQFKAGDEVFGSCHGAFAEYACTPESGLVMKPTNLTFEQAASAPVAAFTALQGLRDRGRLQVKSPRLSDISKKDMLEEKW